MVDRSFTVSCLKHVKTNSVFISISKYTFDKKSAALQFNNKLHYFNSLVNITRIPRNKILVDFCKAHGPFAPSDFEWKEIINQTKDNGDPIVIFGTLIQEYVWKGFSILNEIPKSIRNKTNVTRG